MVNGNSHLEVEDLYWGYPDLTQEPPLDFLCESIGLWKRTSEWPGAGLFWHGALGRSLGGERSHQAGSADGT